MKYTVQKRDGKEKSLLLFLIKKKTYHTPTFLPPPEKMAAAPLAHPVVAALEAHPEGTNFTPLPLRGSSGQRSVIFFSKYPLSERRQAFIKRVAGANPVGFYSQICVKADTYGDKISLDYAKYAVGVLKAVHAKIIVLIGTTELGVKGKRFAKFSRPPSLQDAGNDQKKLTELWEPWFEGEWAKVPPLIEECCDNEQNRLKFLQPKRKADRELNDRDTKTSKAEKPKCVEEPLNFNW